MHKPVPNTLTRLKSACGWGLVTLPIALLYAVFEAILMSLSEWLLPKDEIDTARNFDTRNYKQNAEAFGNHLFQAAGRQCSEGTVSNRTYRPAKYRSNLSRRRRYCSNEDGLNADPIS